jgi:8-oxo-dGTP diphosphatase
MRGVIQASCDVGAVSRPGGGCQRTTNWARLDVRHVNHPVGINAEPRKSKLDGFRVNVQLVKRNSSGKTLADYPRPSVAVDTAVLTVARGGVLEVLLVRDATKKRDAWALPGTFLHEGERLADAVRRSLEQKAGLRETRTPRQLHVFDDPRRDDRGRVLSVAHVVVLPWDVVAAVVEARPDDVRLRPVTDVGRLRFDHPEIIERAVEEIRADHRERPDPECLLPEPFTLPQLRRVHEAVAGRPLQPDSFRRRMTPHLRDTGETQEGTVGRPALLYVRADGRRPGDATEGDPR